MNNVALIGRLTKDPEVLESARGTAYARFTLAVDRAGGEGADFISCKVFGKSAEFLEDFTEKGQRIGITGRIETGRYENKDGHTVYTTDVIADRIYFADGKAEQKPAGKKPETGGKSGRYNRR